MLLFLHSKTRETDAGSLAFRLILTKYVLPLGWYIQFQKSSAVVHLFASVDFNPLGRACLPSSLSLDLRLTLLFPWRLVAPAQFFFRGTISRLEHHIECASVDLVTASQRTPIHGPLLAIRYMIQDINFKELKDKKEIADWQTQLERLLVCLRKATNLVLPVVSAISPEGLTSAQSIPDVRALPSCKGAF